MTVKKSEQKKEKAPAKKTTTTSLSTAQIKELFQESINICNNSKFLKKSGGWQYNRLKGRLTYETR